METAPDSPGASRSRLAKVLEAAFFVPAGIALFALAFQVTLNAFSRKVLGQPIHDTLELSQYWYLPAVAAPGFVVAQLRREHIMADLLFDRFPAKAKRWVEAGGYLLSAVVSAGAAWFTWGVAMTSRERGKTAGFSDYVTWPFEAVVSVSLAALSITLLASAYLALRTKHRAQPGAESADATTGVMA